ncbi:MAG: hypothetical protein QXQ90_08890 [Desulfurococcaceae archaeon]
MVRAEKKPLKAVAVLVSAKKPYYIVTIYDRGWRIEVIKRILKPEFITRWFTYNQSLLEFNYAVIKEKRDKKTISIAFDEAASRHFTIYVFYLWSISNLRSSRKVDCLAKCWSMIDAISPVADILRELSRSVDRKRFVGALRGYCLCH